MRKWSRDRRAVRRGIARLDRSGPAGWRGKVVVGELDMWDGGKCVLGQVYGDYTLGLRKLGLSWASGTRFGFTPRGNPLRKADWRLADSLKAAWTEEMS